MDDAVIGSPAASRMLGEIEEQPAVLERCLRGGSEIAEAVELIRGAAPEIVVIAARGSSAYAGLYARSLIETRIGIPVLHASAGARTIYGRRMAWHRAVVLGISQAGQSPDVCTLVADASVSGTPTIAITNDPDSPLAGTADVVVPCRAGAEAITATKSYLAELALLAAIVVGWTDDAALGAGLERAPSDVAAAIEAGRAWLDHGAGASLVSALAGTDRALVVSRGHNLATARETALKIAETGGILADGLSAADFLHGYVALATGDVPLLAIRPDGPAGDSVDLALEGASLQGGSGWLVGGSEVRDRPGALCLGGNVPEELTPLTFVVPGQLVAEATARARGRDPDRPPGLVKVIRTY